MILLLFSVRRFPSCRGGLLVVKVGFVVQFRKREYKVKYHTMYKVEKLNWQYETPKIKKNNSF